MKLSRVHTYIRIFVHLPKDRQIDNVAQARQPKANTVDALLATQTSYGDLDKNRETISQNAKHIRNENKPNRRKTTTSLRVSKTKLAGHQQIMNQFFSPKGKHKRRGWSGGSHDRLGTGHACPFPHEYSVQRNSSDQRPKRRGSGAGPLPSKSPPLDVCPPHSERKQGRSQHAR